MKVALLLLVCTVIGLASGATIIESFLDYGLSHRIHFEVNEYFPTSTNDEFTENIRIANLRSSAVTVFNSKGLSDPRNQNYSEINQTDSYETRRRSPNHQLILVNENNITALLSSTNNFSLRYRLHPLTTTIFGIIDNWDDWTNLDKIQTPIRLIIIMKIKNTILWAQHIPFCQSPLYLQAVPLAKLYQTEATCESGNGFPAFLANPHQFVTTIPRCDMDRENFFKRLSDCGPAAFMLIMKQKLNFTYAVYSNWRQLQGHKGLRVCQFCDTGHGSAYKGLWMKSNFPGSYTINGYAAYSFFYCEFSYESEVAEISWNFLTKSFDVYCWLCILGTAGLFSLLQRHIGFGFDVIFVLLLQPFQMKWSKFYSGLMAVFIICGYGYLAIITRDVIVPVPKRYIQTFDELTLEAGRLCLLPTLATMNAIIDKNVKNKSGEGKAALSHKKYFLVDESLVKTFRLATARKLAETRTYQLHLFQGINGMKHFRQDEFTCHFVRESSREKPLDLVASSFKEPEFSKWRLVLESAGIGKYWTEYHRRWYDVGYSGKMARIHKTYSPIGFLSPLLIIFRTYGILIGISAILGGFECRRRIQDCITFLLSKTNLLISNVINNFVPKSLE